MRRIKAPRLSIGAALLVASAGAAYPWPAWISHSIFTAGYYKHGTLTTLVNFNPVASLAPAVPKAGVNYVTLSGYPALIGTTSKAGSAFTYILSPLLLNYFTLTGLATGTDTGLTLTPSSTIAGTEPDDAYIISNITPLGGIKAIIHQFTGGAGGGVPTSGLTIAPNGTLYGTASGGKSGGGVVYELRQDASGAYLQKVIYDFGKGMAGSIPRGGLQLDSAGDLWGSTAYGGKSSCSYGGKNAPAGCGVIFKLSRPKEAGKQWTEIIIHSFMGADGAGPGSLTIDKHGNIYGGAVAGGAKQGYGTIFMLAAPAKGSSKYQLSTLWDFGNGDDGDAPNARLAIDRGGALYGLAQDGAHHGGVAFILVPPAKPAKTWQFSVLHSFGGRDGANPQGGLAIDPNGTLYGTTEAGGTYKSGTLFQLVP